ncbi:MAG: thiaminase II [Actinomycetota bacterium]|nr:thiaminase II [Actinomycetota bacterium]
MTRERFTQELWKSITPVYEAILEHPFLMGLADGTLDEKAFRFYVIQDAHYLRDYARALSICSARSPQEEDILMFAHHAAGAIEVERSLHESFFTDFGVSEAEVRAEPVAPTTLAYTSYLVATAYGGDFSDALAAVLPCYWIYWEVGKKLLESASPNPLYQRWIDTYGGEEFGDIVTEVLRLTDRVGAAASDEQRRRMTEHFATTSRYEWMFWDMGYVQQQWPA